jgi:hypothetical protein
LAIAEKLPTLRKDLIYGMLFKKTTTNRHYLFYIKHLFTINKLILTKLAAILACRNQESGLPRPKEPVAGRLGDGFCGEHRIGRGEGKSLGIGVVAGLRAVANPDPEAPWVLL